MITSADSYNTIEFDKYYAILPADAKKEKYLRHFNAKEVAKGFQYNSGTNDKWETVEGIRKKIKKNIDPDFNPAL